MPRCKSSSHLALCLVLTAAYGSGCYDEVKVEAVACAACRPNGGKAEVRQGYLQTLCNVGTRAFAHAAVLQGPVGFWNVFGTSIGLLLEGRVHMPFVHGRRRWGSTASPLLSRVVFPIPYHIIIYAYA